MRIESLFMSFASLAVLMCACERVDVPSDKEDENQPIVRLDDVAMLLSEIQIGKEQMGEVFDAVSGSTDNGYDEEYTMQDLFRDPGSGVGMNSTPNRRTVAPRTKAPTAYANPMRDLLTGAVEKHTATKSSRDILQGATPEAYIDALQDSNIQIYWPYAESWDWEENPVITFDPEDGSEVNLGYEVSFDEAGNRIVKEVIVTEEMAQKRPVWVVNRNDDSDFTSIEMLRKNDPNWGNQGGNIIVTPKQVASSLETRASSESTSGRALLLKDITLKRNLDSWFAGASELVFKIGAVEDFTASTEAELRLYSPQVTDFVVVVKRKEIDIPRNFNAILVSNWTSQLEQCAFLVTEDDGGTRQTWACSATVKVQSKSYGFDISLPLNSRDDIVWRGQLSYNYITASNGKTGHFGDIDLVFEILDY